MGNAKDSNAQLRIAKLVIRDLQNQLNQLKSNFKVPETSGDRVKEALNKVAALQAQLKTANLVVRDLQIQLNQLKSGIKNEPVSGRLNQTVDQLDSLQGQLRIANLKINDLRKIRSIDLIRIPRMEPMGDKLKQALDKIDEQGRMINVLTQKLLECGQTVDFSKMNNQQ